MHDNKKTIAINPVKPEHKIIVKAGKIIQNNKVVIFPTTCLYGIAVKALDEKAVQKVIHLKKKICKQSNPYTYCKSKHAL